MHIKHLVLFTVTICLLASCKKNSGSNSNGSSNKLKMYIETDKVGGTTLTDTFYVSYDNSNLLTSKFTYTYSRSGGTSIDMRDDYTYDNGGNLLKDVQSDGYGTVNQVTAYTYTTHPINVSINPTDEPLQAKYLPATATLTDGTGSHLGTITYTYTFDGSGRLTKETDAADNGDLVVKTYIYE